MESRILTLLECRAAMNEGAVFLGFRYVDKPSHEECYSSSEAPGIMVSETVSRRLTDANVMQGVGADIK